MPDKETQRIMAEGEQLLSLVKSDGWAVAKGKLIDYITGLDSISNIDATLPADKQLRIIEVNRTVTQILLQWLRDVEGNAQSVNTQKELLNQNRNKGFIVSLPDNKNED